MVLADVIKMNKCVKEYQRFGVDDWGVRLKNGLLVFIKKDKKNLFQLTAHGELDKKLRPRNIQMKDLKTKAQLNQALRELSKI